LRKQTQDEASALERQLLQGKTSKTWLTQELEDKEKNIEEMKEVLA
jgi:hypothetical protein